MGIMIKVATPYVAMEIKWVKYMQSVWNIIDEWKLLSPLFGSQALGS